MTAPPPGASFRERRGELRWNEGVRALIAAGLRFGGGMAAGRLRARLRRHAAGQRRLRRRYRIEADTPLTRDLPPPEEEGAAGRGAPVALTSGTSGAPRAVAYPRRRLALVRRTFIEAMARLIAAERVRRTGFYAFGSFDPDRSLGSLLTAEPKAPSRFALLQAPYRAHADPALRKAAEEYGVPAARLLAMAASDPGILYATNPSTITVFFDDLEADWERARRLAAAVGGEGPGIDPAVLRLLGKIAAPGAADRLERVAASAEPLPVTDWAPSVRLVVCWSSGAAAPFLAALDRRLPPPRFRRTPMFSMSTETLETIPDYRGGDAALLPAAPGVFYEFLPADGAETPEALLPPGELTPGREYEMVVSHGFGLRRYRTGDLFRVERRRRGLPDLRFARRRGIGWSFTGEKLTGAQVESALEAAYEARPELRADCFFALFPEERGPDAVPGYCLAAFRRGDGAAEVPPGLVEEMDRLLAERNLEYRAKRESGRLGPVRLRETDRDGFVRRAVGGGAASLDSQFKFQAFYPRLWED